LSELGNGTVLFDGGVFKRRILGAEVDAVVWLVIGPVVLGDGMSLEFGGNVDA